jgi:putative Ig domain-containing protein/ASPM-SPD-2-Hydin domain-containing protein
LQTPVNGGSMSNERILPMARLRFALTLLVSLTFFALGGGAALASHGGGGGGGGTPPPSGSPAVTLGPASVTYAAQAVGTTSAAQTISVVNTGSASLFVNGISQSGVDPLDFARVDDQCSGITIPAGGSCTIAVVFKPTATGTRTATMSILDNAPASPQAIAFSGTGTSDAGPTPLQVDTTGLACTSGVCDLGSSSIVGDFLFTSFGAIGDTAPPFSWALVGGALPAGLTLFPNGQVYGTPSTVGSSTFTLQVTDPNGKTATQSFRLGIAGRPAAGDPNCQHAPSQNATTLTGPAIGGRTPGGQAVANQSTLTACGGFVTINVSVKDVNLPDGTVLWVTLSGRPIGRITLSNGAATIQPYVYPGSLRKLAIQIYAAPPPLTLGEPTVLSGGSFS